MDVEIIHPQQLSVAGLSTNESRAYLTLLKLGEATAVEVGRRAGLQRTYVYDLLRALAERGFVSFIDHKPGVRRFRAVQPKRIEKILMNKLGAFRELIPELESYYTAAPARPRAQFFDGRQGIEAIHRMVVEESKENYFFGATEDWIKSSPDWYAFAKEFIERGIIIKDLVKDIPETRRYQPLYVGTKSEMRFLRPAWQFASDFSIWNNKVALLSYAGEPHGIVIESTSIARSFRTIFEILWSTARRKSFQRTA